MSKSTARERIEQAINELAEMDDAVINVMEVHRASGVSRKTIYQNNKDLVERIQELQGKDETADAKQQLARRKGRIGQLQQQKQDKQADLDEAEAALARARSVNARLQRENENLAAEFNQRYTDFQQQLDAAHKVNQSYLAELNQAREQIKALTAELARH